LTKKAPYKGLRADSEEKHDTVSDIDIVVVDSLKAPDRNGRLEKRPRRQRVGAAETGPEGDILISRWANTRAKANEAIVLIAPILAFTAGIATFYKS
jgi:hypothetical protein